MTIATHLLAVLLTGTTFGASMSHPQATTATELLTTHQCSVEERTRACQEQLMLLDRYRRSAKAVVRGEIIAARDVTIDGAASTRVSVLVSEILRGKAPMLYEFTVDPPVPGGPTLPFVEGYEVLAFVDRSGWLVDGNALFAVEDGVAWRPRRAGIFASPSADRVWSEGMDPLARYEALPLPAVRERISRRSRVAFR